MIGGWNFPSGLVVVLHRRRGSWLRKLPPLGSGAPLIPLVGASGSIAGLSWIKRGQGIAHSGQIGNVNAPQLHFEVRRGATPFDPMRFLKS